MARWSSSLHSHHVGFFGNGGGATTSFFFFEHQNGGVRMSAMEAPCYNKYIA
jgi:hypothetical protein